MTHATPRPFDIDDDGFVNFDATGYSVEAYKIKPLLDTLDEATAALGKLVDHCDACGGSGRENETLDDDTQCTVCGDARTLLTDMEG